MAKKKNLPVIQKKISAYIMGEEGRISKQSLIAVGAFLGSAALSSILLSESVNADHSSHASHLTNALTLGYKGGEATGTHSHHASHGSHDSHSSY